jgi:hypothetical protein
VTNPANPTNRILKVWIVRNPSPLSVFEDVCFEIEIGRLPFYMAGCPGGASGWAAEGHAMYLTRPAAEADARARFAARDSARAS